MLSPITADLMGTARTAGAVHSAWSGAGPAAITFVDVSKCDAVESALKEVLGSNGEVRCLDVARQGLR